MNANVALETTVLSHGLPWPANRALARDLDAIVQAEGARPRSVGIVDGRVSTDCTEAELDRFCQESKIEKVSLRNLPVVTARGQMGATTVAATIRLAYQAGIRVMATGGIGGVHGNAQGHPTPDESADLTELGRCPVTAVCAGPKAILHLGATRERLESFGVTVIGWQTDRMPAFYCGSSPYAVDARCDRVEELADIVAQRDVLGLPGAILVTVPVPDAWALPFDLVSEVTSRALADPRAADLLPHEVTPYLLATVRDKLGERALDANVALLKENARIAAQLAVALSRR
ncbi:MAG: pseudouridine-5'-phosphate glycosidase [Bacteroidota bacterium]|nr:pseudouridine-5'-phosphate glycosidase [Bacteroidota bacterium]